MKLTDETVLEVIRELGLDGKPVRGVRLRQELNERFGVRASTDRVYRLIRRYEQERLIGSARQADADEVQSLRTQVAALTVRLESALRERDLFKKAWEEERKRAELAEYREEAHFDMWAEQLHDLRRYKERHQSAEARRARADAEKERFETLKALTRAQQQVAALTQLLESNGIEIPRRPE